MAKTKIDKLSGQLHNLEYVSRDGDTMTGTLNLTPTSVPALNVVAAGTDADSSAAVHLRANTDEFGTKIIFWKNPTGTASTDRVGQITAHGTESGSSNNEMAFYTTDVSGAMTNRFKVFGNIADQSSPLILTGATGVAKSSGAIIKLGEDVASGGTSKVQTMNDLGVRISPVSRLHVYEDTTGTGSTAGITVEQDGTGDSVVQFLFTATERWMIGVDNSDSDKFKITDGSALGSGDLVSITPTTGATTFTGDVSVPDEAYDAAWNGSLEVPTKNAVYDKIETIVAGSGISESLAIAYAVAL